MTKLYNQKTISKNFVSTGIRGNTSFVYKGFDSNKFKTGFKLFDADLVKQDILNHFHIRKGEKLENPDFGTIIWDMLFEPFTEETKRLISQDVETIVNYDPRIRVNAVIVDSTQQGIRIEVELIFLPFNISESLKFDFDRQNLQVN